MLVTVRARPSRPGSLQRSVFPRGAPARRRVHCDSAHEDAAPAPIRQPGGLVPPGAVPPAKPVAPTGMPKGKQLVKRFLERVEALNAGQQTNEGLLREILKGRDSLAAALERSLAEGATSREDLRSAQAALAAAAAGLQKASADAQQQGGPFHDKAAAQALERVAQLEAGLAATRKEAEAAQGRDREALGKLEAEVEALRGELAAQNRQVEARMEVLCSKLVEATLEAAHCAARNRQLEVELSALRSQDQQRLRPCDGPSPQAPARELLSKAICQGRLTEVRRLIATGADLDEPDADGVRPLMHATEPTYREYLQKLTALLEAGADVAATNKAGQAVLHWSMIRYGAVEVVRRLIEAGAYVNAIDEGDNTPLHYAALYERTDAIRLLLEAGADIDVRNKAGRDPHYLAPVGSRAEELLRSC
ncbi:Ankyrin repeat-containing protein [Tetrabaena socialis]|uniref:Ankyrin repeat-containing protein n=1 Tax=Tetrabaena socialis TaxID=47790 RepID=A0A2J8AAT6_9CHLO|nr:Ankyrin repeat-containing protein [Tetrabaena socialis]|eukprot:PNH09634.1 Ankyrin repeat-containing protein [Tetrabaena socialis]